MTNENGQTAPRPGRHADAAGATQSGSASNADDARVPILEEELAAMSDRWIRAEAEIANVRSRAKRDVEDARQYAVQKFATDVVEAAENLRRGLDCIPPASPADPEIVTRLREGFLGIESSFLGLLERNGIVRDDPTGAPFDPKLHQAMSEGASSTQAPGTVLQALSAAWTLNGRLLRPAMVVVAKAVGATPEPSRTEKA